MTDERAITFQIGTDQALGIFHPGLKTPEVCILMMPAGAVQYRVGVGRQLVRWARKFSEHGISVFRFDSRGVGDSEGSYRSYTEREEDIRSAIDTVMNLAPEVKSIILWGGCEAASCVLDYAWRDDRVHGLIVMNPFLKDAEIARGSHYRRRAFSLSFWRSLFTVKGKLKRSLIDFMKSKNADSVSLNNASTNSGMTARIIVQK